jgi:uncharacterized CHY-type Zn-finger protein
MWYICGKCKKDYENHPNRLWIIKKVVLAGYADILCHKCRDEMEAEIKNIAKKFLKN